MLNGVSSMDSMQGLSEPQVKERQQRDGKNELIEQKKESLLKKIVIQLSDVLMLILIAAAVISFMIDERADAYIIALVIILNVAISIIQEYKADDALAALKNMTIPTVFVKREGELVEINTTDLVVGDLVRLETGKIIPADLEILIGQDLQIDEAAMTGESVPVHKEVGEKVAMSTVITGGNGFGRVTAIGMDTEIGKIAALLGSSETAKTPLQESLNQLGKTLGLMTIVISIVVFLMGYFQGRDPLQMFMLAISLAVAAIPEGLPAVVTIVLALGVTRMVKQHVIVRKLPAVETLGSVDVICSDKTGTLTQNKMKVLEVMTDLRLQGIEEANQASLVRLKEIFSHCHHVDVTREGLIGEPTEVGLVQFSIAQHSLEQRLPISDEIPFDSTRKMMTTIHETEDGWVSYTKGAIDRVLAKCTHLEKDGQIEMLTEEKREQILALANEAAHRALRVLAGAYQNAKIQEEQNLIFVGFAAMMDPPREEVKDALKLTKRAGIRTVMITGDDATTAFAIAQQLGLTTNQKAVMTGQEIENYSKEQLQEKVKEVTIFARVSPIHKVQIVQALKANDWTVSMTGDGVNDAPSLKEAHVGVAMGITGTDVAKGAADIILTDDNFSSIVQAVRQGRTIFNNIKKTVIFLLSSNLGEVLAIFMGLLLGWPTLLRPVHILWVNLVTDTLPALALGVDDEEEGVMDEKPRKQSEHILHGNILTLIFNGLWIGGITLLAFILGAFIVDGEWLHGEHLTPAALMVAQTMAFLTLSFSQLVNAFNLRSQTTSIFSSHLWSNRMLNYSLIIGLVLQIALISIGPLANVFHLVALGVNEWLVVIVLSLSPILLNEMLKIKRRNQKNHVQ